MRTYIKNNITVIEVEDKKEGSKIAFELLKRIIDKKTLLFLSGGNTPKDLYKLIAQDSSNKIVPGAVATVDERWGYPGHKDSNEKMIEDTGLYKFMEKNNVEIHTILHGILKRPETAKRYDIQLRGLFERFKKSVSIMGIGVDGHTAGLAANINKWQTWKFAIDYINNDSGWFYPERITITPTALNKIKNHIILVFGSKKKLALEVNKYPAKIFKNMSGKVYLITDQKLN
jgi:6-phosphogluconolactonase/glucosamine-6-phosphate isomerase/deaminase